MVCYNVIETYQEDQRNTSIMDSRLTLSHLQNYVVIIHMRNSVKATEVTSLYLKVQHCDLRSSLIVSDTFIRFVALLSTLSSSISIINFISMSNSFP